MKIRSVILFFVALFALSSCCIHQWPESKEPDAVSPEPQPSVLKLKFVFEPDFYVWEHSYDPVLGTVEENDHSLNLYPEFPGTSSKYSNILSEGVMQIHVKVYDTSDGYTCISEQTYNRELGDEYNHPLDIELDPDGSYDVVAWAHLFEAPEAEPFYDFSDFNSVSLIEPNYHGNTDYRDGFRGLIHIKALGDFAQEYVVNMKRPMGKFQLLTTDLSEFLDRETSRRGLSSRASVDDYKVTISFPLYFPNAYSVLSDCLTLSSPGFRFDTQMSVTGDSEASLGFEYVMLNNSSESGVQARVDVYYLDGTRVAGSSTFTIPMKRDCHTLLRGAFLSMEGNGGVGIDPGFNGDHNVTWP